MEIQHDPKQRLHVAEHGWRHRQDLLFHDGSVRCYRPDSTNPGWNPTSRSVRKNMTARFSFTKKADLFGGLDNNAASSNFTCGWYRWTRGGLNGWDVPRLNSMIGKLPSPGVVENEVNTNVGLWQGPKPAARINKNSRSRNCPQVATIWIRLTRDLSLGM